MKPQNILVTDDGCAKISDFGLSLQFGDGSSVMSHRPGGSRGWQAPEQLGTNEQGFICKRSMDIFSLGLVLHYVMTGVGRRGEEEVKR